MHHGIQSGVDLFNFYKNHWLILWIQVIYPKQVRVDTNVDWNVGADIGTRPQVAELLQIR